MKSSVVIGVMLLIVVLGVAIYIFGINDSAETGSDEGDIQENPALDNSSGAQEPEEFQIFQPTLTYEGAYNGPLYATSEQIGDGYDIDLYMANLDRNGVNFFIGMFPILGEQKETVLTTNIGLGYVINNVKKYPHRIIPFFSPGFGGEEIEDRGLLGEKLTSLYRDTISSSKAIAGEDFIRGFGEVETQEWSVRHNDPKVLQLTNLASANNISFMFHPVASKIDDVEKIIEAYPDTNFLIHMYREDLKNSKTKLIEIMQTHDNIYFSIDAAHIIHQNGNDILYDYYDQYGSGADSKFISTVNSNYNSILSVAVSEYKTLVAAVPDKVMWGTEAGPEYSFEPEVYDLMVKTSRDFISKVTDNLEQQEALGYKNALRVFGEGVILEREIQVADTGSWPLCTEEQIVGCDGECGIEEDSEENSELEICFNECLFAEQCVDPED